MPADPRNLKSTCRARDFAMCLNGYAVSLISRVPVVDFEGGGARPSRPPGAREIVTPLLVDSQVNATHRGEVSGSAACGAGSLCDPLSLSVSTSPGLRSFGLWGHLIDDALSRASRRRVRTTEEQA